jgi:hypothetical protein
MIGQNCGIFHNLKFENVVLQFKKIQLFLYSSNDDSDFYLSENELLELDENLNLQKIYQHIYNKNNQQNRSIQSNGAIHLESNLNFSFVKIEQQTF